MNNIQSVNGGDRWRVRIKSQMSWNQAQWICDCDMLMSQQLGINCAKVLGRCRQSHFSLW